MTAMHLTDKIWEALAAGGEDAHALAPVLGMAVEDVEARLAAAEARLADRRAARDREDPPPAKALNRQPKALMTPLLERTPYDRSACARRLGARG